jgi:hypothetical protein
MPSRPLLVLVLLVLVLLLLLLPPHLCHVAAPC